MNRQGHNGRLGEENLDQTNQKFCDDAQNEIFAPLADKADQSLLSTAALSVVTWLPYYCESRAIIIVIAAANLCLLHNNCLLLAEYIRYVGSDFLLLP